MPPKKKAAAAEAAPKAPARRSAAPKDGRGDRAAVLLEYVNKKMKGRAELVRASELSLPYITKRWPTGLLSLDVELKGGWPAAGVSQVIGPRNAGKDYLVWQTFRQAQQNLRDRFYGLLAMTEMRADRTQARAVGCQVAMSKEDIESMERARVNNGWPPFTEEEKASLRHEVGHIHEAHGYAVEDLFDIILRAVESRVYHIIVINSLGNIMSAAEAEAESMRDKTYGGAAGPNTQFLHKLTALLTMKTEEGETRDTCVIGVNQVRDNIKDPNKPYKAPGGNALEHAKFVDLFITSGKQLYNEIPLPVSGGSKKVRDVWGKEVNWRIEKGKAGMHEGAVGNYVYRFHQPRASGTDPIVPINSADFYMDTIATGQRFGVVSGPGWYNIVNENGQELLEKGVQGQENFAYFLYQDAVAKAQANDPNSYMNFIRRMCFRKADINIDYDWD